MSINIYLRNFISIDILYAYKCVTLYIVYFNFCINDQLHLSHKFHGKSYSDEYVNKHFKMSQFQLTALLFFGKSNHYSLEILCYLNFCIQTKLW